MLLVVWWCVCVCVCCPSLWVWWNPQGRACSQSRLNTPDSSEAHKVSEVHPKTCIGEQTLTDLASASNHRAPRHESLSLSHLHPSHPPPFTLMDFSPNPELHCTLISYSPCATNKVCSSVTFSLSLHSVSFFFRWTVTMTGMWGLYASCFLSFLLFFFWALLKDFLPNTILYIWRRYIVHLFIFYLIDWLKCSLQKCKQQEMTGKNNSPKTNNKT